MEEEEESRQVYLNKEGRRRNKKGEGRGDSAMR